tara:strand:+ start:36 stop:224 length:189 start_codon:yes stop_codon:yes gene_type:complete
MKKVLEEKVKDVVVNSVINEQEKQALGVLIQAVKIATNKGAFDLDDAFVIGNAKNILQGLIK